MKTTEERAFYIHQTVVKKMSLDALKASIARDDYHHQGSLPNNFVQTLPAAEQAFKAINTFKDEYLLDYINVEELGIRDRQDIDERVVENSIIHNVKNSSPSERTSHLSAINITWMLSVKISISISCFLTGN